MPNKLHFDTLTTTILEDIENCGGKVYIVGGTVRDLLIYGEVDYEDVDVEVYHLTMEILEEILSKYGVVNEVGKNFGILKVSCLPNFDFALPRKESSIGDKHTDFIVEIHQDMEQQVATLRRDITMNAMMYEYCSGRILDFHHGKEDIENKTIRIVNQETFKEDPLRVLRVARFMTKYQFKVDATTQQLCKEVVASGMLASLSKERVYTEYCKILMTNIPSIGFHFLSEIGALPKYLSDLKHTSQRLDYHPEGNVWNHTLLVLDIGALVKDKTSNPIAFMWSCLLHDIGKPKATTPTGSAPKHHIVGVDVFNTYCSAFIKNKEIKKYIKTMIKYHMELMNMAKNKARDKVYYRLLKDIDGIFPIDDLLLLTKCDKLGRLRDGSEDVKMLEAYLQDKIDRLGKEALIPCITGDMLVSLGYQPSINFSKILKDAYVMQMQGRSKEDIIKEIRRKY